MRKALFIHGNGFNMSEFDKAVEFCERIYGYEGLAWNIVINSNDMVQLRDFLLDDGVPALIETT
jgi:hypothetical protein